MIPEIQYYAVIAVGHGPAGRPSGLARRIFEPDGPVDQTLGRDLTWIPDSAIVEWEYGDLSAQVVQITEDEAARLKEAFRATWAVTR
jgi:hypothetical protein